VSFCLTFIRALSILTIGSLSLLLAQQQPTAPAPQATPAPAPASQPAPAPETNPDQAWSIELFYWLTHANPDQIGGAAAADYETVGPLGPSENSPGVAIGLPLTQNDVLQISGFQMRGRGASIASQALDVYGTSLPVGYLSTEYRVRSAKVSFEDFLYPYPKHNAKLRFKTLWEAQYVQITSTTTAPLDSSYPSSTGSHGVILPTFGLAMQYAASTHLRLELRGSAFGIPHHQYLVDSEATAAYRIGPVQIVVGGRFFEFKTSPKAEEYYRSSIFGAMAGLRYTIR